MDIKSLSVEYLKRESSVDLYDLTQPSFYWRTDINLSTYTVTNDDEMRIDTIFRKIYNLEENTNIDVFNNLDIILYLNNIDNPLNIKKGMVISYPPYDRLDDFRLTPKMQKDDTLNIREKLIVPNKSTIIDKNRQKYKDNDYSIPPVVTKTPKSPVSIDERFILVGGL
jgi:hypothetical protein